MHVLVSSNGSSDPSLFACPHSPKQWTRQWAEFNPDVEPIEVADREAGRTDVKAHQLVENLHGDIISDQTLFHVFTIVNGLFERMNIGESKPAFGPDHAG